MGEKENPWIRLGQGGSISGWLKKAQKLIETTAMAILIRIFALVMNFQILSIGIRQDDDMWQRLLIRPATQSNYSPDERF
jgi:hypothetical protein